MKKPKHWLRTNLAYGLVVVIPLAILLLLLAQLVALLQKAAVAMGFATALGAGVAIVLACVLLLLACVGVGAAVRTRLGAVTFERAEQVVLRHIPGYQLLGNIMRGFSEDERAYPAVLVHLHGPGSAVLGLLMEELADGMLAVFVPSAPAATVGSLHVVARDRVTRLETGAVEVLNCASQWGIGAGKALGDARL